MSGWAELWLGVIAVSTLASAVVQIGVLVAAGRLAKRIEELTRHLDRELKPFLGHLNAIGRDASRAASLATAQVERANQLCADAMAGVEQMLGSVRDSVSSPVREGAAILAGFRAALDAVRDVRRRRSRTRAEDDDALFI